MLRYLLHRWSTLLICLALAITIPPPVLERRHCRASIRLIPTFNGMRVLLRGLQKCVRRTGSRGDPKLQHMMELLIPMSPQHGHTVRVHCLLALAIEVNGSGLPHDPDATEWAVTWPRLHATGAENSSAQRVGLLQEL